MIENEHSKSEYEQEIKIINLKTRSLQANLNLLNQQRVGVDPATATSK